MKALLVNHGRKTPTGTFKGSIEFAKQVVGFARGSQLAGRKLVVARSVEGPPRSVQLPIQLDWAAACWRLRSTKELVQALAKKIGKTWSLAKS